MSSKIVRLRGEAQPLAWPASKITPQLAKVIALHKERPSFPRRVTATEFYGHAPRTRPLFEWLDKYYDARRAAAAAFGAAQGWSHTAKEFSFAHILRDGRARREARRRVRASHAWIDRDDTADHVEWFVDLRRVPIAAVVHLYTRDMALGEVPAELIVDRLPCSWYMPDQTQAYVLRPNPAPTSEAR